MRKKLPVASVSCLIVSLTVLTVTGCGNLSRRSAADQIIIAGVFRQLPVTVLARVGKSSTDTLSRCYSAPDAIQMWALHDGLVIQSHHGDDIETKISATGNALLVADHESIDPVQGGSDCDQSFVPIVIARFSALEVTGIVQQDTSASADFVATWELTKAGRDLLGSSGFWKSLSHDQRLDIDAQLSYSQGRQLQYTDGVKDGVAHSYGSATFVKYDDGWRLKKIL